MKVYYCPGMAFFGDQMIRYHGFERYNPATDIEETCFFEGLYYPICYETFIKHQGKRIVFWNGSDLQKVFDWKERMEMVKTTPAIHLCHDESQVQMLGRIGVEAKAHPVFFGDINKYPVSYKQSDYPQVYSLVHEQLEGRYGLPFILAIAEKTPQVLFNIYGVDSTNKFCPLRHNVVYHGWIEEDKHDREIAGMQGCFQTVLVHPRPSQLCLKSAFMAQWPLATTEFGMPFANTEEGIREYLNVLVYQDEPNYNLRDRYVKMYEHQWEKIWGM